MQAREEKESEAGMMYTTTSSGITCYDIFTRAGFYRGGKIYDAEKSCLILSGRCKLISEKVGKDTFEILLPSSGIIKIPSLLPHLFEFSEDTRMLEWFPEETKSEDFERYRQIKK